MIGRQWITFGRRSLSPSRHHTRSVLLVNTGPSRRIHNLGASLALLEVGEPVPLFADGLSGIDLALGFVRGMFAGTGAAHTVSHHPGLVTLLTTAAHVLEELCGAGHRAGPALVAQGGAAPGPDVDTAPRLRVCARPWPHDHTGH